MKNFARSSMRARMSFSPPISARGWPSRSGAWNFWKTRASWLRLHAPAPHGDILYRFEDQVLDKQSKQDNGQQTREYIGNRKLILLFEDVPAETTRTRADAEYQLRRDKRTPGERPSHL